MVGLILTSIIGALVGGIVRPFADAIVPPNFRDRLRRRPDPRMRINGLWDSYWSENEAQVMDNHELVNILWQRGNLLRGEATRDEEQDKKWVLEGRYDGTYLQMLYYPSAQSRNPNFSDYGCYFFVKQGNGTMKGLSIGRGPDKDGHDSTGYEYCFMKQRQ